MKKSIKLFMLLAVASLSASFILFGDSQTEKSTVEVESGKHAKKAFENAQKFYHNCESGKGWESVKAYVAEGAQFSVQAAALAEITTVQGYVDWVAGLQITAPGNTYDLHASAYDEENKSALFFGTFTGTHSGDGGPVPPTNKTTNTHYVYVLKFNDSGKIVSMTKIWNAPWALKELGWM